MTHSIKLVSFACYLRTASSKNINQRMTMSISNLLNAACWSFLGAAFYYCLKAILSLFVNPPPPSESTTSSTYFTGDCISLVEVNLCKHLAKPNEVERNGDLNYRNCTLLSFFFLMFRLLTSLRCSGAMHDMMPQTRNIVPSILGFGHPMPVPSTVKNSSTFFKQSLLTDNVLIRC